MKSWFFLFLIAVTSSSGLAAETSAPLSDSYLRIRDPFKQGAMVQKDQGLRTELENFPTEKFLLVGVMSGLNETRAMLLGPNKKTYVVTQNTKIGLKKGVIEKITPDLVVVKEKVLNLLGQEEIVDVNLPLDSGSNQNKPGGTSW